MVCPRKPTCAAGPRRSPPCTTSPTRSSRCSSRSGPDPPRRPHGPADEVRAHRPGTSFGRSSMNPDQEPSAPQAAPAGVAAQVVPATGSSAAERARQEARRRVLHEFTADVRRRLEGDSSPAGQLLANHIGRQLDLGGSERYTRWFRDVGERSGFDQGITLAAIAGSDVTKMAPFSEEARAQFGTTAEHVDALVARGDLR